MCQQMLSSLLSSVYCRREACKHASDRSLLCLIYITGCLALSSQGFLDGITATGTFHPLLQRGKPVKDFSCFSTISQLPSQNLSIIPPMGWQERTRVCCVLWRMRSGLDPLGCLFRVSSIHLAEGIVWEKQL